MISFIIIIINANIITYIREPDKINSAIGPIIKINTIISIRLNGSTKPFWFSLFCNLTANPHNPFVSLILASSTFTSSNTTIFLTFISQSFLYS